MLLHTKERSDATDLAFKLLNIYSNKKIFPPNLVACDSLSSSKGFSANEKNIA